MARTANPDLAERRRTQIMEAAMACFRRRGFHQTSMQEICAEANLSPGALYRYFPSKTDIIAAISASDAKSRLAMLETIETGAELIDRLVFFADKFVAKRRSDAPLVGEILAEALRDPDLAARMRAGVAPMHALLAQLIRQSQARGEFDPSLEPTRAARWVLGAVDGVCMRAVMSRREDNVAVGDDLRALLVRLLAPRAVETVKPVKRLRESVS
jgi:AcrR family transcriptional regulator